MSKRIFRANLSWVRLIQAKAKELQLTYLEMGGELPQLDNWE
jgi:hypothetical protein